MTLPAKRQVRTELVDPTGRPALWRQLLGHPLLWALIFLGAGLPWYLNGNGLDFLPFILTLLGGWFCGHAFVRFTFTMANPRLGFWVHALGALVFGAALMWAVNSGKEWLEPLSRQAKYLATLIQMAAIPGVGWVWVSMISRISGLARRPSTKAQTRTAPQWQESPHGITVSFPALQMSLNALGWIIAGVVIGTGAIVVPFLIYFDWILETGSATLVIVVVGTLFALPAYFLLKTTVGQKTVACTATFRADQLRLTIDGKETVLKYRDIDFLLWRTTSDYARLEVISKSQRLTLIAGFAKVDKTALPELPPLSHRTRKRLTDAGLAEQRSRRPDVVMLARDSKGEIDA